MKRVNQVAGIVCTGMYSIYVSETMRGSFEQYCIDKLFVLALRALICLEIFLSTGMYYKLFYLESSVLVVLQMWTSSQLTNDNCLGATRWPQNACFISGENSKA